MKEQLYRMIKSAYNDPNADKNEVDRYLDLINEVNDMLAKTKKDSSPNQ